MRTPEFKVKRYFMFEGGISFVILLTGIISYLRTLGFLVYEKESRNVENMQNMGVRKFTYFSANLVATIVV